VTSAADVVHEYLGEHSPEAVHDHAVLVDHATGARWVGPDGIAESFYDWYHVAFPGATAEVERLHEGPTHVTVELCLRGRNDGPLDGRSPTGADVRLPMCLTYEVSIGRINRIDLYYDRMTLHRQLGISPR
jgi:predicted ester cyclase